LQLSIKTPTPPFILHFWKWSNWHENGTRLHKACLSSIFQFRKRVRFGHENFYTRDAFYNRTNYTIGGYDSTYDDDGEESFVWTANEMLFEFMNNQWNVILHFVTINLPIKSALITEYWGIQTGFSTNKNVCCNAYSSNEEVCYTQSSSDKLCYNQDL